MKTPVTSAVNWMTIALLAGALLAGDRVAAVGSPADRMEPSGPTPAAPVGTVFTYQGRLDDGGTPATGLYDFQFALYDAAVAGVQVGSTVTVGDIPVSGGVFTTGLDFGSSAFGGGRRWMQIGVRPGASGGAYTPLTPRQELTPAPYALAMPNVYTNEAINFVGVGRDFRISGNEIFGLRYTGSPRQYGGMYMETSDADGWPFYGYATNGSFRAWTYFQPTDIDVNTPAGWRLYLAGVRLTVPTTGGLRIGPALDYSLVIQNTTGSDGIRVLDTGDDAIQIGSPPDVANYGVYIPSPGVSTYGLWSNTANASGEWALYTVDNIQAGNVFAAGITQLARVAGSAALLEGDVVSAVGVGDGVPGAQDYVPSVSAADAKTRDGVIGVVKSRMGMVSLAGKEGEDAMALQSLPGAAQPGEFVAIVVQGVAQVRIDAQVQVKSGERLTASDSAGRARPLQTRMLDGMAVTEGAAVLGVALGDRGNDGMAPVYVRSR